jgi:cytochrome c-type biogenesis protein CcmH/NrfG
MSTVPLPPVTGPMPRPPGQPPTPAPVLPRRSPVLAFALGAVLLAALGAWLVLRPRAAPAPSALAPTDADAAERVDRARARGDLAAARAVAESQAKAHPGDAGAFAVLGHVLFAQGEKDRALAAYREAVRMDRAAGAAPELLANLRATFADAERGEAAFKLAEDIGEPAEAILRDVAANASSGALKRRAADATAHIAARKGESR